MSTIPPAFLPARDTAAYAGLLYAYAQLDFPAALVDADDRYVFLNPAALDFFSVDSLAGAPGCAGDNWGGRLAPVAAVSGTAAAAQGCGYQCDKKTARVFLCRRTLLSGDGDEAAGRVETLHEVTDLYEGDERVKAMLDAAPFCCNYWNDAFQNIDCNLEAVKLFALPDKQTYLDRFMDLSPEFQPNGRKSPEEVMRHLAAAFRTGYERFEWMHQKLNGEPIPSEITLVKVQTRGGDVVIGYTHDLRSVRSVADVDDLDWMATIFDILPFPVGVAGNTDKWLFMNRGGLDFFGTKSIEDLTSIAAVDWGGRLVPLAADSEFGGIHYLDKANDAIYRRSASSLKDSFGGIMGRVECLQEVTALYEAEERIRAMIDAAPLCCNFWNEKFENIDCNLEAAKLFELPDKKAYLERFFELSPALQPNGKKSAAEAVRHIATAFKDGYARFEWLHQKLNGEQIPAEITLVRVSYRKGNVVLGYTRDLRLPKNA